MRRSEGGEAPSGDFQVDDGGLVVCGFDQGGADFIVCPGCVGLQFDGSVQLLRGLGVLAFLSERRAQRVFGEIEICVGGDDWPQGSDGSLGFRWIACREGSD